MISDIKPFILSRKIIFIRLYQIPQVDAGNDQSEFKIQTSEFE